MEEDVRSREKALVVSSRWVTLEHVRMLMGILWKRRKETKLGSVGGQTAMGTERHIGGGALFQKDRGHEKKKHIEAGGFPPRSLQGLSMRMN